MQYCETSDGPPEYKGSRVWCEDHKLPAEHCGPDGDSPVCATYAKRMGCNCCPETFVTKACRVLRNHIDKTSPLSHGPDHEITVLVEPDVDDEPQTVIAVTSLYQYRIYVIVELDGEMVITGFNQFEQTMVE